MHCWLDGGVGHQKSRSLIIVLHLGIESGLAVLARLHVRGSLCRMAANPEVVKSNHIAIVKENQ